VGRSDGFNQAILSYPIKSLSIRAATPCLPTCSLYSAQYSAQHRLFSSVLRDRPVVLYLTHHLQCSGRFVFFPRCVPLSSTFVSAARAL
jgi:hypothetical protein